MKPDQERVKQMLAETILLLCKNGLHFTNNMTVQGLLGITLDDRDIFMIHLNEVIHPEPDFGEIHSSHPQLLNKDKLWTNCSKTVTDTSNVECNSSLTTHAYEICDDVSLSDKEAMSIKTEPNDAVLALSDNTQCISQGNVWANGLKNNQTVEDDVHFLQHKENHVMPSSEEHMPMSYNLPSTGRTVDFTVEVPHSIAPCKSRTSDHNRHLDFHNIPTIQNHPRHSIQQQLQSDIEDNFTNILEASKPYPSSSVTQEPYRSSRQNYAMDLLFVSRYRPKNSADKEYHCTYPGCSLSFYARRTLLRHQTQKHGRPKSYVRHSLKSLESVSGVQYCSSCDTP